jgi:hypothetical protein
MHPKYMEGCASNAHINAYNVLLAMQSIKPWISFVTNVWKAMQYMRKKVCAGNCVGMAVM